MQARELRMRHAQSQARNVTRERLDRPPIEKFARADALGESPRHKPAQQAPQADIDTDYPVPAAEPGDLDVVRANKTRPVDVDQLPIEHVLLQQHLLRPSPERLQI